MSSQKMIYYRNRLASFKEWPCSFIKPQTLAKSGFYYTGVEDEVVCAFCSVGIWKWENGDDPLKLHQEYNPRCLASSGITDDVVLMCTDTTGKYN